MRFLALSGSLRGQSTTTSLLRAMQAASRAEDSFTNYRCIETLPIFSPDPSR